MRAAVLYGREDVRLEEVEEKGLQPGEVRVEIASALTCGTDLKVFKRGYHAKMIVPPALFGHELAGRVSEVAPGVAGWSVGDRVVVANSAPCGACPSCLREQENLCDDLMFLNGAYAESIVVPPRLVKKNLLRLKPETPFRDAALTEPLACVIQGLEECAPHAGDRLLVLGAGPIGLMFCALANEMGCEVTLVGRGQERLEQGRKLGIPRVIDVGGEADLVGAVGSSDGAGFDVVIEAVGQPEVWQAAVQLVRKGGTVNFFGGCPAGSTVTFDTGLIHYSNLKLLASFHHRPHSIRRALDLIERGVISAANFVDGECRLSELPNLLREMAHGNRAVKTAIRVRE